MQAEITTPNGNVFHIRPLTQAIVEKASRQLQVEGIKLQGNNLMHESVEFSAELARQVIDTWKGPAGGEPIAALTPRLARREIKEIPGLADAVVGAAQRLAEREAEGWKVDLGN